MLTPKEKAKELVEKYRSISLLEKYNAKQCALIAVNEIIEQWDYLDTYLADIGGMANPNLNYWLQVKNEIEKL